MELIATVLALGTKYLFIQHVILTFHHSLKNILYEIL